MYNLRQWLYTQIYLGCNLSPRPKILVRKSQPPKNWNPSVCDLYESGRNMEGWDAGCWHAMLLTIGLVAKSEQPPCPWLVQVTEWNPSISATLVIEKKLE